MKNLMFLLAFLFILVGCSDDSTSGDKAISDNDNELSDTLSEDKDTLIDEVPDTVADTDTDTDADEEEPITDEDSLETTDQDVAPVTLECADFKNGLNEGLIIDGTARTFTLALPDGEMPKDGWPVVFAWHGLGDSMENFESYITPHVNNSDMPFIAIVPENDPYYAVNGIPPKGIDWDIINTTDGNVDAKLFDTILECLDEKYTVDKNHIHTAGFSAGSIMSDSLGVLRGDTIASIFTYSGGYFSNSANVEDMASTANEQYSTMIKSLISWPELSTENKYTQVIVHGVEGKDQFDLAGLLTVDFNRLANNDAEYLSTNGHNVIICSHEGGRTIGALTVPQMITFFANHPLGAPSPYLAELPEGYDACKLVEAK